MNRRAFLKWLGSASAVVLVAPSLVITPTVEPVVTEWRSYITFAGKPFIVDKNADRSLYYMVDSRLMSFDGIDIKRVG